MALFNLFVNLFGLALWINWLASRHDPLASASAATLAGTLKRARNGTAPRWRYPAGIVVLLLARAWLCLQLSSVVNWTPRLKFILVMLAFRSDFKMHMLVYSFLGFAEILAGFYLWLILLSLGGGPELAGNTVAQLVQVQLKGLARLPALLKLLFPFALGAAAWAALHPLLDWLAVVPDLRSSTQLVAQAAVMGAGTYLAWKYLLIVLLLLHIIHSYIHLGGHPFWKFIDVTTRNWLRPLRWLPLQVGKIDLRPWLLLVVLILVAVLADHPPERVQRLLFSWLPF